MTARASAAAGRHSPLLLVPALLIATQVLAQSSPEDDDLARLPAPVPASVATTATAPAADPQRLRLEDAYTAWSNRTRLPVPTGTSAPAHQNRLSLDADLSGTPAPTVRMALSDRLSRYHGDDQAAASSAQWLNDLREAWVSWQPVSGRFLQAGRVNLRQGVAQGYNPTDFFKARATVAQASIDPSAARDNRLGTVMAEAQLLWPVGTLTLAWAPAIAAPAPLVPLTRSNGFDAGWGRTNGEDRALLSFGLGQSDFSPQFLAFRDQAGSHWGLDFSHEVGSHSVAWLEWAGTRAPLLSTRALHFAQASGTLPAGLAPEPQPDPGSAFRQDLSTGASWTSSDNLTVTLEYHHHDGGFSGSDFARWATSGAGGARPAQFAWLVRAYAADQQEPLMRSEWFVHLDWQDVIPSTLNLGALAFVQPHQGTSLVQLSLQYLVSRRWSVSAYTLWAGGPPASEYGSLPARGSAAVQADCYF